MVYPWMLNGVETSLSRMEEARKMVFRRECVKAEDALYFHQENYRNRVLHDINLSRNRLCPFHQGLRMVPEYAINSIKTSCRLPYNEYHFTPDIFLNRSTCRFHRNHLCYTALSQNFIKNNFLKQCLRCGRVNEYAKDDQNMEKRFQKLPIYNFCDQVNTIHFARSNSSEEQGTKSNVSGDFSLSNKSYSLTNDSTNDSTNDTQNFVYHSKDSGSNAYLRKIMSEDTFNNYYPKNILYNDNLTVTQNDIIECDTKDPVNEDQLNVELFHNQSLNNIDIDSIDVQDDHDNCIDVQDSGYELQVEKQKNIYIQISKKRGRPKRKTVIRKLSNRKSSRFKEIMNNITVSSVLRSFHNKKRHSKRHIYIRRSKSPEKSTKNIKDCSDPSILKKKTSNFIKKTQVLDSCDEYKELPRKKKCYKNTNEHPLNDTAQSQEFPHLFGPAPRLPLEIKDGQRLGKKYCRKYNLCDLTYIHVHRQISASKVPFHDINESQSKDDSSFDILSLIPREMVPVITSNGQLGFREAIIDKRLMRYKRGVPIFRVGRKIPGELSSF